MSEIIKCKHIKYDWGYKIQCKNNASTPAGYCRIHDPEIRKKKYDTRSARWKKQREERAIQNKRISAHNASIPMVLDALKQMVHLFDRGLPDGSIGFKTCEEAKIAIKAYEESL